MREIFLYNEKTHTLHIEGYCVHASPRMGYKKFLSEDDALAYDGRAVGVCKLCQKKRERIVREKK